jgi:3-oxoadipate enol-lactonase
MPFIDTPDLKIHYRLEGRNGAPLLVFSNSLGSNLSAWDAQVEALGGRYRILRYDSRGHGQTAVTPGPYSIPQLAADLPRLLDALGLRGPAFFCGLSIGGQVGMWLGRHESARFSKLVLCNTAARIGSVDVWNGRIDTIGKSGLPAFAPEAMGRWFTAAFRESSPAVVAKAQAMVETSPLAGYLATCAALRESDQTSEVGRIGVPTLVIAGRHDPSTPPAQGRALAEAIPGARYVELEASHLSNLEAPEAFTTTLAEFLAE